MCAHHPLLCALRFEAEFPPLGISIRVNRRFVQLPSTTSQQQQQQQNNCYMIQVSSVYPVSYIFCQVGRSLDTVLPAHRITTCEKLMNHFNAIFVGQIRTHGHYNTRFFVELAGKCILLGRDGVKTLSLNGCSILVCYTDPPISGNPRISIKKLSIRYSLYSFPFYLHPTIQPDWIYSP